VVVDCGVEYANYLTRDVILIGYTDRLTSRLQVLHPTSSQTSPMDIGKHLKFEEEINNGIVDDSARHRDRFRCHGGPQAISFHYNSLP